MPDNDLSNLPTTIASLVNLKELDISKNGKLKKKSAENLPAFSTADCSDRRIRENDNLQELFA